MGQKGVHRARPNEAPGLRTRPMLRGYLHLVAAVASAIGTVFLLQLTQGDIEKQVSLAVYCASAMILFGWSAAYHVVTWSEKTRRIFRRIDHANIFLLIAGTYTPIIFNLLPGGWRAGILTAAWTVAALGIILAAPFANFPRKITIGLYILAGWIVVTALPQIIASVRWPGLAMMVFAGLTYTAGAFAYAMRRPRLWPRFFGYHEVFHLATVVANATFFVFMILYVVPAARP